MHIAIATHHRLDAIVSWNFKHLVNLRTIEAIHAVNLKNKYPLLEIITIEQLGGDMYGNV